MTSGRRREQAPVSRLPIALAHVCKWSSPCRRLRIPWKTFGLLRTLLRHGSA